MLRIFTTTYLRNYGLMNIGHRNDESIRGLINFELKSIWPILTSSKADAAMICTSAYLSRYHVSPILPPWILIFPLILIFHPLSRNKRKSYYIFPVSLRDIFRQSYFLAVKGCCLCQCSPMFVQCINSCRRCPRTCAVCWWHFFRFVSRNSKYLERDRKKKRKKKENSLSCSFVTNVAFNSSNFFQC